MTLLQKFILVTLFFAALTAIAYVARRPILTAMGRALDVHVAPEKCDLVFLLNGDYTTRPAACAYLLRHGFASQMAFTKCHRSPAEESGLVPVSEEVNFRVAEHYGVSRNQVVMLPGNALTTFDEVDALAVYLDQHPVKTLAVVTEWPHTRRAKWITEKVLGNRAGRLLMVAAPMDQFQVDNWWQSQAGVEFIITEYFKLIFYWFRYGILGYIVAGAFAAAAGLAAVYRIRRRAVAA